LDFALKSVDELFPTPLLRFEIKNAADLNRSLLKEIAARRKAEDSLKRSNRNGWHSEPDLFERKEPAQAALAQMLLRIIAKSTRSFAPDADFNNIELLADGWVNVNPKGAYNAPHDHIGSFWSGCYYVQVPDDTDSDGGAIEFLSPHKPLPSYGLFKSPITGDKLRFRPEPGLALIFPSSLTHWVHPNDSEEDRVTIAFNGRFRPKRVGVAKR
jgi:uncharacterized protein (TIGR02466 family)